jgi:hypothetical protein
MLHHYVKVVKKYKHRQTLFGMNGMAVLHIHVLYGKVMKQKGEFQLDLTKELLKTVQLARPQGMFYHSYHTSNNMAGKTASCYTLHGLNFIQKKQLKQPGDVRMWGEHPQIPEYFESHHTSKIIKRLTPHQLIPIHQC